MRDLIKFGLNKKKKIDVNNPACVVKQLNTFSSYLINLVILVNPVNTENTIFAESHINRFYIYNKIALDNLIAKEYN